MRVAMIGSGYVGLVSGTCFADFGHTVCCVDRDAGKVAALQQGSVPIFEPGLSELVAKNVRERRLSFATGLEQPVREADAVFSISSYVTDTVDGGHSHYGQFAVRHHRKVIETAARYGIMVNAHEPVRPTGLHRTYQVWVEAHDPLGRLGIILLSGGDDASSEPACN